MQVLITVTIMPRRCLHLIRLYGTHYGPRSVLSPFVWPI